MSEESSQPRPNRTTAIAYVMNTTLDFEEARRKLYDHGVKSVYDEYRVVFTTKNSAKNTLNNKYAQEANGLVLQRGTWRHLVVPPRSLRNMLNTEETNKFLHQKLYHIYRAEDGTSFNLYWWDPNQATAFSADVQTHRPNKDNREPKWTISTAKGLDMNDVMWDNISYRDIINECLEKIGLDWDKFTAQLDKNRCYSFGFKHPSFHKFFEGTAVPVYKIWFIQSVSCNDQDAKFLMATDKTPIEIIQTQDIMENVQDIKELYKLASTALADYLDYIPPAKLAENKDVENRRPISYGFILRSVSPSITNNSSDLYIESSLMRTIKQYWYENSIVDVSRTYNWNKEKLITLNAFLNQNEQIAFRTLFPQYVPWMNSYNKLISDIVQEMQQQTKSSINKNTSVVVSLDSKIANAASKMLISFNNTVKHNPKSLGQEQLRKLYYEFVCNVESLECLMDLI